MEFDLFMAMEICGFELSPVQLSLPENDRQTFDYPVELHSSN